MASDFLVPDGTCQVTFYYHFQGEGGMAFTTYEQVRGEQNLYNITTVASSPGNIWTRQVLDLIGPGAGSELRLVFEAKILDPSISSHVAVDDVSFKKSCLFPSMTTPTTQPPVTTTQQQGGGGGGGSGDDSNAATQKHIIVGVMVMLVIGTFVGVGLVYYRRRGFDGDVLSRSVLNPHYDRGGGTGVEDAENTVDLPE